MQTKNKPRLFIGSSSENLATAHAIQENLEFIAEVTVWHQGFFQLTKSTLTNLLREIPSYDFAVFVFAPDDFVEIRSLRLTTTRDNVIFELGLFMAAFGEERTFIVKPRGIELHLPTDLAGITPATYEPNRSDNNLPAALGPACSKIAKSIETFGPRSREHTGVNIDTVSKCYYQIINKESEKAIDVSSASMKDGAIVHLWDPHKWENQIWEITHRKLNLFSIIAKHSNKCLEVKNSSLKNSAGIQQNEYIGADNQLWQIILSDDGSYFIIPNHAKGKCLEQDASSTGKNPGKLIQHDAFQHNEYGRNHQKWILKEVLGSANKIHK